MLFGQNVNVLPTWQIAKTECRTDVYIHGAILVTYEVQMLYKAVVNVNRCNMYVLCTIEDQGYMRIANQHFLF